MPGVFSSIWQAFAEKIPAILPVLLKILQDWWWVPVLIVFFYWFRYLYLYFIQERYFNKLKFILLEIKIPEEVIKPIKAMEHVFAGFHSIHDVFIWREKWIEGQFLLSFSLEIVSIDGKVHFYIHVPDQFRHIIESNIYSQYPEAEISQVEDYTKNIPQDIPNKDWDLFGTGFLNPRPDPYPLKTYTKFESDVQPKEEKRVDPLAGLLEGMATLKPGEQLWLQIIAKPVREENSWIEEGLKIRDKLARRPEKPKQKSILREAAEVLATGSTPGEAPVEEKEFLPPEMKLTPGEREIVQAIEEKISKFGFDCAIRYIYLGRREAFFKPNARMPYGFFKEISSENLGGLKPDTKKQMTKVKSIFFWFLDKRRIYLRKRKIFRYYQKRLTPFFPRKGGTFVLNTEELATLYHFPGRVAAPAPAVPRIEAKKSEPPSTLPIK
jgi:hypothetical protein